MLGDTTGVANPGREKEPGRAISATTE